MSAIYDALANAVLASDGAMGTMLQERGLTDGGAPELWNVEKPEEIEAVLEAYAACLLYTSPSPRDRQKSRMPSSA